MILYELLGCPKCTGDLRIEKDLWGDYVQCNKYGFVHDLCKNKKGIFKLESYSRNVNSIKNRFTQKQKKAGVSNEVMEIQKLSTV